MRFRIGDRSGWSTAFDADGPQELRGAIARVWDSRIERVRLDDGATEPAFALAARLKEIAEWIAVRRARLGATSDQLRAWEHQAAAWEQRARLMYGGTPGEVALFVRGGDRWFHLNVSGWATLVQRNIPPDVAHSLWIAAQRTVKHAEEIDALRSQVAASVDAPAADSPIDWLESWDR